MQLDDTDCGPECKSRNERDGRHRRGIVESRDIRDHQVLHVLTLLTVTYSSCRSIFTLDQRACHRPSASDSLHYPKLPDISRFSI